MIKPAVLAFDIQGTAADFYAPLMRMGAAMNAAKGLSLDWAALSIDWRDAYRATMDAIIEGHRPWIRADRIYRMALDVLIEREGLASRFTVEERDTINTIWTRLDAWPDSVAGLERLRRHHTLVTLSNAGMAAVIAVVKQAAMPFDAILTAELVRSYKPAPDVYRLAMEYTGAPASAIMMVACHKYDLHAARAVGMRTAFVARPLEFGPKGSPDCMPDATFDLNARDFLDLADQLGA